MCEKYKHNTMVVCIAYTSSTEQLNHTDSHFKPAVSYSSIEGWFKPAVSYSSIEGWFLIPRT